jgi:hypothetical protein
MRFLLFDSRTPVQAEIATPPANVFFIFVSDRGLQRLRMYRHWSMDGTFSGIIILVSNIVLSLILLSFARKHDAVVFH